MKNQKKKDLIFQLNEKETEKEKVKAEQKIKEGLNSVK